VLYLSYLKVYTHLKNKSSDLWISFPQVFIYRGGIMCVMTPTYKSILIGLALTTLLFSGYFISKFTGIDYGRPYNVPLLTPPNSLRND